MRHALPRIALLAAASLVASPAAAQLTHFSDDFEARDINSETALGSGMSDWVVSGLVFDSANNFQFFYGNFDAPNGSAPTITNPAFSAIATGEEGPAQGMQSLNVFSDYNCCDLGTPSAQGHGNGTDIVESNVFRQQTIGSTEVLAQETATFTFDAKLPGTAPVSGTSEAIGFIRTLDPNANFN
ncbi:MAG: hypothetical protein AAFY58_05990, partial [Planctomycetota bacterium]